MCISSKNYISVLTNDRNLLFSLFPKSPHCLHKVIVKVGYLNQIFTVLMCITSPPFQMPNFSWPISFEAVEIGCQKICVRGSLQIKSPIDN